LKVRLSKNKAEIKAKGKTKIKGKLKLIKIIKIISQLIKNKEVKYG